MLEELNCGSWRVVRTRPQCAAAHFPERVKVSVQWYETLLYIYQGRPNFEETLIIQTFFEGLAFSFLILSLLPAVDT